MQAALPITMADRITPCPPNPAMRISVSRITTIPPQPQPIGGLLKQPDNQKLARAAALGSAFLPSVRLSAVPQARSTRLPLVSLLFGAEIAVTPITLGCDNRGHMH